MVLAATDPANPYGAALPWPPSDGGHRPGRKAGALVVLVDGALVLYLERGGRSALTYPVPDHLDPEGTWAAVAGALVAAVRGQRLTGITVARIDGAGAIGSQAPLAQALVDAGFHTAPQGLRLRR